MKALADKCQGQDGKPEADDGSDEAFLKQAKLEAQQALRILCLAKTMMLRKPMSVLGTTKLRPEELWDMHFQVMVKLHIQEIRQSKPVSFTTRIFERGVAEE